ncbi:ATP-binding protein [Dactylosporangium sp. McL0621]|uniref:ATP-binding protein n=1 Tax=Dactylosporangium sp. McL0621 TaxID=3415678 RepID=UPI003CE8F72B
MRIWRDGVELSAGPRQQAYLLALLLAREGRPISIDELVGLIWGEDAPASALNATHKYVGALRRLLEPALLHRKSGSYILRRGSGYLCAAGPGALDLVDFRSLVASARVQLEERRGDVALELYLEALGLWEGPAGDGMVHGPAATAIFAVLNDEFFEACVAAAELAVTLGEPERVLPPLQLAAGMAPFHEPVQASLVTALGAAGQQAAALAVFTEVRTRLAEELGIDPGHALDSAHRRVLRQNLTRADTRVASDDTSGDGPGRAAPPAEASAPTPRNMVGRVDELAVLRAAFADAAAGDTGLVLVEGEPGAGKTRLLEETATEAAERNAIVVWGSCLEGDGAPSMWPWIQVVDTVLGRLTPADRDDWLAGELGRLMTPRDDAAPAKTDLESSAQFRLFEQVLTLLDNASALRPVVLVIDDLQWAEPVSLQLLGHLASRQPRRTLVLGALRDRAPVPSAELAKMLAAMSRLPHHRRILLGPLVLSEVVELVRRETGHRPSDAAARSVLNRTAGNPLFIQELSRFLSDGGELTEAAAAQPGVPATVRDIVLDLVSSLDEHAKELLQLAALIGRDVDLGLLARAADLDIHTCLGRLEAVEGLGLLGPAPGDPFSLRFAHDLVRESVSAAIAPQRAAANHLRIADTLDGGLVDDSVVERLAFHLWAAGPLGEPARTVAALMRAGRRAAVKTALGTAERQLRSAIQVARTAGLAELELAALSELISVVQMSSPTSSAVIELQERAEGLAFSMGRQEEATVLLYSRWMAFAFGTQYARAGSLARRLLDEGSTSSIPVVRALGLQAWGLQEVSAGRVGEGLRYLTEANPGQLIVPAKRADDLVWYNQQLSALGMLAETTAAYGDVVGARALLDKLESMAGEDPYKITIWAGHSARTASVVGDPDWVVAVTRKGIAADPDLSFGFFGVYQRLARLWALGMTGHDPGGAATELEELIRRHLIDPPRMSIATWYGLLAELRLAEGAVEQAAASLGLAEQAIDAVGQRYAEGLILLIRARLLQAQGQPGAVVKAAAEAARDLATSREAHLFARRAEEFMADVGAGPA